MIARTTSLRARAFRAGSDPSASATATLTFATPGVSAAPTMNTTGGRFAARQTVSIAATPGATIRYTLSGADPTETDPVVPVGGLVSVSRAAILKVRAWEPGLAPSPVTRADLVISGAVSAGGGVMLALDANGVLWAWGQNASGAVGDGTTSAVQAPVSVLTGVTAAATSGSHTLAVRNDGSVWAWGDNAAGRLGDGTTTPRFTPVQVVGLADAVAVAVGSRHSLALTRDGRVWAWGDNVHGQLGDGTTTRQLTPVQVVGLDGVSSIAAGTFFSLAVQRDGGDGGFVWAWGRNDAGQLGDGSTMSRAFPVQVLGVNTASQVAASHESAYTILADGTVRAWGENAKGELGNASTLDSATPVVTAGVRGSRRLTGHGSYGMAVDRNGLAWGLGKPYECVFGAPSSYYAKIEGVAALVPGIAAGADAANGSSSSIYLTWDGRVWTTGHGHLGFGALEQHCSVRALPGFTLADNAWLLTDADGDGLVAWREYDFGSDPLDYDSDDNGLSDGIDASQADGGATPDEDGDGVANLLEIEAGTDPFSADTDGDGVADGADAFPLDPARHQQPEGDPADTTPPVITLTEPTNAVPRP